MSLVIHTLPVEKYWFMVYNLGVLFGGHIWKEWYL